MEDPKETSTERNNSHVVWHSLSENLMDLDSEEHVSIPRQEPEAPAEEQPKLSPVRVIIPQDNSEVRVSPISDNTSYQHGTQKKRKSGKHNGLVITAVILVIIALICTISILKVNADKREQAEREARIHSVEDAINSLGTISPDSLPLIEAAEAKLNSLPQEEQNSVSNLAVLSDAREEYQHLDGKLQAADAALNAIRSPITVEDKSAIEKARKAFDALKADDLSHYRREEERTLVKFEEQWTRAYANSLIDNGNTLREKGKYQEALDVFYETMDNYQVVSFAAKKGAVTTLESWLQECYNAGDYETVYNQLQESQKRGLDQTSDTLTTLGQKLDKALKSKRPLNGKVLDKNLNWGYCEFTVTAGNQDVCYKLESVLELNKYVIVYVRKNETATIKVEDGSYFLKYTLGDAWFGNEAMFGKDAKCGKIDGIVSFNTTRMGSWVYYSEKTISLFGHNIGDTGISIISRSDW